MSKSILELMQVPAEDQDVTWLQQSLQTAIELELSTLPPYLCGMWSITDQSGPVYDLIHSVVMEEMLHMGLACNMLTTIGGTPQINTTIPTYPGPLPGGVRPELTVYLAGLSKDYLLNVYMQIEYPENGPVAFAFGLTYPTIGAFYDAILAAFQNPSVVITGQNQLTGNINGEPLFAIKALADVEKAINEIKEQGEGTSQSPLAVDFGGELAHYYKYAEIWHGFTLVQQGNTWQYTGAAIPFPSVYSMSPIPAGGYPNPSTQVQAALTAFNQQFTEVLNDLQAAWANGSQSSLGQAIGGMFSLQSLANAIMQFPLPGGGGVYGPDFLLSS
jgi:hypothetical protein